MVQGGAASLDHVFYLRGPRAIYTGFGMSLIGAKIGRSFAGATCPFLEVSAKRFSRINNSIIWQGRIGMATARNLRQKGKYALRVLKFTTYIIAGVFVTAYVSDSRASIYSHVLVPVSHSVLDPETAHRLAILMLSMGLAPRERVPDAQELEVEVRL